MSNATGRPAVPSALATSHRPDPPSPATLTVQAASLHEPVRLGEAERPCPLLVLWEHCDADVRVRHSRCRATHYRPAAGALDLHGLQGRLSYEAGAGERRKLMVCLPAPGRNPFGEPQTSISLVTRLNFQDAVLARLVRRLHCHQCEGEPHGRLYSHLLSSGIVRRVTMDAGVDSGRRRRQAPDRLPPDLEAQVVTLVDRFIDAPLDAEALACATGLGVGSLQRRFRGSFGTTVHQYLMDRRIERAKRWLEQGELPMSELAQRLGFAHHAHFSSSFAARTGMAPSRYRSAAKGVSESASAAAG